MGILNVAKILFKKRTLLAILLTIAVMVLLRGFYRERVFELSFDVKTAEPVQLQVYYSQAYLTKLNDKDSIVKEIEPSSSYEQVKVALPVNSISSFIMAFKTKCKSLCLKNIKLNNITLDLGSLYFNKIDEHSLEDGILLLKGCKEDASLDFGRDFGKVKRNIAFHFKLFVILLFFVFLINYKLVQYMVRLKLSDDNSRLDIAFLAIFFIGIFVPMMHISNAEISNKENRTLAKYIPFIQGKSINQNFGSDFELYFNDRFFGRDFLMDINGKITANINKYIENAKAFMGKDNWMFKKVEVVKQDFDEEAILAGLDNYIKFCKDNNIACYIEIAPARVLFALDKTNKKLKEEDFVIPESLAEKIKEKFEDKFIYPYTQMLEADKSDYVYFKTDGHWTEWGAYIGYKALIEEIQKDFKEVSLALESDFDIFSDKRVRYDPCLSFYQGTTAKLLNLSEEEANLDIDYKYYTHKNEKELKIDINEDKLDKLFHYPEGADYNVVLLGNSFTENFSAFLPYSFKNVKKLRANNVYGREDNYLDLNRWEKEILDFKADIMIILIQYECINTLSTIEEVK